MDPLGQAACPLGWLSFSLRFKFYYKHCRVVTIWCREGPLYIEYCVHCITMVTRGVVIHYIMTVLSLLFVYAERALYCFECSFHTLFNVTQANCRLSYSVTENRSVSHSMVMLPPCVLVIGYDKFYYSLMTSLPA